MCRSKKLFIAFSVCVSIKTISIASLLQEQEQEFNENYYLGDENGFLILNNDYTPFKLKLYPKTADINNIERNYIKINTSYLYSENGFLLATKENNEIICILNGSKVNLALAEEEEDEKKEKIKCELFKKTNPNNLDLVFVEDNKKVEFKKDCTFILLPHNYPQYNIKFDKLQHENKRTLTNTEGHPLLASIKNNEIIIFYKKKGEGCFNAQETISKDERYEVKLVDSSIKTKSKDCCCCFSLCF